LGEAVASQQIGSFEPVKFSEMTSGLEVQLHLIKMQFLLDALIYFWAFQLERRRTRTLFFLPIFYPPGP
jgi:hypothetical protein